VLFPDRLIVRVVMAPGWRPVRGVGVMLTLHAAVKNHYHLIGTTDGRGEAVFTREFVEAQIDEDKRLAGMDYSSSLAECSPVLRVRTMDQDDVARANKGMEMWGVRREKRWENGGTPSFFGFRPRDMWRAVGGEKAVEEIVIEVRVWAKEDADHGGP